MLSKIITVQAASDKTVIKGKNTVINLESDNGSGKNKTNDGIEVSAN